EDKQVKQVTGQESTTDTHQQEMGHGMKITATDIPVFTGIPDYWCSKGIGQYQHQGRKLIQHQHNPERCTPFTEGIDTDLSLTGTDQITYGENQAKQGGDMANPATPRLTPVSGQRSRAWIAEQDENKSRKCRQENAENWCMLNPEIIKISHQGSSS